MRTSVSMSSVAFAALGIPLIGLVLLVANIFRPWVAAPVPEVGETKQDQKVVEPEPVVAPVARMAAPQLERVMVVSDELDQLRKENERLRARVAELEASFCPTTQSQLAVALALSEADVQHCLDRSELLPNADALGEALRIAGPKSTWEALQAESAWYRAQANFRLKNPKPEDRTGAIQWHQSAYVPFFSNGLAVLCDRLYAMGMPSTIVEPFRSKQIEGI